MQTSLVIVLLLVAVSVCVQALQGARPFARLSTKVRVHFEGGDVRGVKCIILPEFGPPIASRPPCIV